ncbi:hypothetical protein C8J57DRAFT_1716049 [Mycena rebaudengoi]|nr:hypothetical protein C8J57DRAFT_1716049 [Mycena rebaudengoi]
MKIHFAHLLAFTICAVDVALALPTADDYPEVIPGPGLPSLASLNLTSAELYQRVPSPDIANGLERRFDLLCNQVPQCTLSDATACFNFLNALGHQACTVPDPFLANIKFCTAGGCNWYGSNFKPGGGHVSSFCDVATGGATVLFACGQVNGLVSGSNAANGNGDLVVTVSSEQ